MTSSEYQNFALSATSTGMNELLEIIVTETNRFSTQKGCKFETMKDKMKAFLGINFIMGIYKLPSLEECWSKDKCIGKEKDSKRHGKNKVSVHLTESSLFQ